MPPLRQLYQKWFRVEVFGAHNLPETGRRAAGRQPLRHAAAGRGDDRGRRARQPPRAGRHLRMLGADLVFRTPVLGSLARKSGQTLACNAGRRTAAARRRTGRRVAGGLQGHRQAVPRPVQAAAVRPRRLRVGGAAHRHADRAGVRSSAPRRSTRRSPTSSRWPGCSGLPYFPVTPLFPLLGPLGAVPLPSKWYIEFGEPIRTDEFRWRAPRTTRCWCST